MSTHDSDSDDDDGLTRSEVWWWANRLVEEMPEDKRDELGL